jgi:hypothetical protein
LALGKKRQQASPRCGFRVPSTPREPERASARDRRNEEEGGRRREEGGLGKKRQQASPRCGFRGTLHAQGARASERKRQEQDARGRRKEEGGRSPLALGRRGSRLRLGADFGVPSTPREPERASADGEQEHRGRRKEEGGKESFGSGEEEAAGFA